MATRAKYLNVGGNDYEWFNLDLIHPVGSIYWSMDSTDPGTLFGGTWERIQNAFIYAANDSTHPISGAGSYGGSERVQLITAELPSHNHVFKDAAGENRNVPITAGFDSGGISGGGYGYVWVAGPNSISGTADNGSDQSHENMPPFITAYCWKRTA